jgi:MarR family transcriptional regulator for hemolysin
MPTDRRFSIALEIYEVFRTMRREFDARARALGFTHGQWRVLNYLGRNEGISQVGLADMLDMQPISLGRVLDRMESSGLIERRPDPLDRRALKLFLAPAAGPMLEVLRGVGEDLRAIATRDLTDVEQETLVALLARMRRNIETSNNQSNAEHSQRFRAGVGAGAGTASPA